LKQLSSLHNPFVKSLLLLKEKSKFRQQQGSFIIEGKREISLAIKSGYKLEKILFFPKICPEIEIKKWSSNVEIIEINKKIFEKLVYRKTTEGVIAIAKSKVHHLSNLNLSKNPLILVAESIEKPGNIGALLRTADAAKLDAVIIANSKCDLYNSNVVRSSVGCLFTNQIAIGNTTEVIRYLQKNKITIYCASLQNSNAYYLENFTNSSALVVGAEESGLSEEWNKINARNVIIPMRGEIDSVNVSVAAAVLVFEAKKQRGF
tara:strand:- start:5852 stop:6637 length:786 start_codon:yes stop_codon:yes gene_type:complete